METNSVIEALRTVVIYLRDDVGVARSHISNEAGIKPSDLDNFTRLKESNASGPHYKTKTPSIKFFNRLCAYILRHHVSKFEKKFAKELMEVRNYMEKQNKNEHIDLVGQFILSMNISDQKSLKKMNSSISGNYYVYRPASSYNKYTKSYLKIEKADVYQKTTRFTNWHREENDEIKVTIGHVFEMDQKYFFVGFVKGHAGTRDYVGMKLIIVGHSSISDKQEKMNGMVATYVPSGGYITARVLMKKTNDILNEDALGVFDPSNVGDPDMSLPIMIQNLANPYDTINQNYSLEDPIKFDKF